MTEAFRRSEFGSELVTSGGAFACAEAVTFALSEAWRCAPVPGMRMGAVERRRRDFDGEGRAGFRFVDYQDYDGRYIMACERNDLAKRTVRGVFVDRELVRRLACARILRNGRRVNGLFRLNEFRSAARRMEVRLYDQNLDCHRQKAENEQ
jgi:hypothetical protein